MAKARRTSNQYCNGCGYSRWRAGVSEETAARLGVPAAATHTCQRLGESWPHSSYRIERLPECVRRRLADYKGAM